MKAGGSLRWPRRTSGVTSAPGTWILANHGVPHNILFSQNVQLPWVDSSWLFDALTAAAA